MEWIKKISDLTSVFVSHNLIIKKNAHWKENTLKAHLVIKCYSSSWMYPVACCKFVLLQKTRVTLSIRQMEIHPPIFMHCKTQYHFCNHSFFAINFMFLISVCLSALQNLTTHSDVCCFYCARVCMCSGSIHFIGNNELFLVAVQKNRAILIEWCGISINFFWWLHTPIL